MRLESLMQDTTAKEILDRCRRIETRLTRWLEQQGFDTRSMRPIWRRGTVHIHSLDTSVRDILSVVPKDWNDRDPVLIYLQDRFVVEIFLGERDSTVSTTTNV